jgi:hypothetical protein
LQTPDFTPPAIAAFVMLVITNLIVLLGVDINDTKKAAIAGLVNAVVIIGFLVHDAIVRHGRANVAAARELNVGVTHMAAAESGTRRG